MDVLDWRRQVGELYRAVRLDHDPARAHAQWATSRRHLLGTHPASPVPADERAGYSGGLVAPYDPQFRLVVPVDTGLAPQRRDLATATDGVVPLERVGRVNLPGSDRWTSGGWAPTAGG